MHHLAIMSREFDMLAKLLDGRKTVESRWLRARSAPWGKVQAGDTVYFKASGGPVTAAAPVLKVCQFEGLSPQGIEGLLNEYADTLGLSPEELPAFHERVGGARYGVLIFLGQVGQVKPFRIDKSGFGPQAAWLSLPDIAACGLKVTQVDNRSKAS